MHRTFAACLLFAALLLCPMRSAGAQATAVCDCRNAARLHKRAGVQADVPWTSTSMVRLRGRCPRGERLIGYAPQGHWKVMTFVAGLRQRAMVAPFVLEGAINRPMFLAYVKQCVVPILKRGDIVIIDNLPAHRVAGVREAIEAVGAKLLYLPSYSPTSTRSSRPSANSSRIYARSLSAAFRAFYIQHAGYVRT
jgi:hypothetical protein